MQPFNWRHYLTVSDAFGKEKVAIECALDDIASTGPDGVELIRKAFINTEKVKNHLLIAPHLFDHSSLHSHANNLGIYLDMEEARAFSYHTSRGYEHVSVTGLLVHELYHRADFKNGLSIKKQQHIDKNIFAYGLTKDQKSAVLDAYIAIAKSVFDEEKTGSGSEKWALIYKKLIDSSMYYNVEIARQAHVPLFSFTLLHYPYDYRELHALYVYKKPLPSVKKKTTPVENDATHYTDVFMARYFPEEPWRGEYTNALRLKPLEAVIIRAREHGSYIENSYAPKSVDREDLGHLQQPSITRPANPRDIRFAPAMPSR